jgi:hypothetical protein
MLDFQELHRRLTSLLLERVRKGELTERGLSRVTRVSQPHIHNVLKGKRFFSTMTSIWTYWIFYSLVRSSNGSSANDHLRHWACCSILEW